MPAWVRPTARVSANHALSPLGTLPVVEYFSFGVGREQEANDARLLRAAIVNILEEACLPGVTDEEKKRLLSFVVSPVEMDQTTSRCASVFRGCCAAVCDGASTNTAVERRM